MIKIYQLQNHIISFPFKIKKDILIKKEDFDKKRRTFKKTMKFENFERLKKKDFQHFREKKKDGRSERRTNRGR